MAYVGYTKCGGRRTVGRHSRLAMSNDPGFATSSGFAAARTTSCRSRPHAESTQLTYTYVEPFMAPRSRQISTFTGARRPESNARCGAGAIASGKPLSPSRTTFSRSPTPRFLCAPRTLALHLEPTASEALSRQFVLGALRVNAHGQTNSQVGNIAVSDLDHQSADEHDRVLREAAASATSRVPPTRRRSFGTPDPGRTPSEVLRSAQPRRVLIVGGTAALSAEIEVELAEVVAGVSVDGSHRQAASTPTRRPPRNSSMRTAK